MEIVEMENDLIVEEIAPTECIKEVGKELTPFVGQKFDSLPEAEKFYRSYAEVCGFDVRRSTTKRWRDGTIKSKLFVCNREGFTNSNGKGKSECKGEDEDESDSEAEEENEKQYKVTRVGCKARIRFVVKNGPVNVKAFHEGHTHELVSASDREFLKSSRNLSQYHKEMIFSNYRLKIGATKVYKMEKEKVNGFENIGAHLNDFKNYSRDIKCFIHGRDGQLFIDRFESMKKSREGFYFDYDVDKEGRLRRAIWADETARRNYAVFGDAVSFDPTYKTNTYSLVFTPFTGVDHHKKSVFFCAALIDKEDYESFNWVFSRFLTAMDGKEPVYIITDQDPGIIKSVGSSFKSARHRFCMWHIMNKVPNKFGAARKDYNEFLKKLNDIVWDDVIEPVDFDSKWNEIMEAHQPADIDWFGDIFAIRKQWVMAHCRDLNMGGIMRTTQRSESVNSFFKMFEDKNGTLVEFWSRFESAMDQQRHTMKKLDCDQKQTEPKKISLLGIEGHGAKVYTHEAFSKFQEEVKYSTISCSVRGFNELDGIEFTKVKDSVNDKVYEVKYHPVTMEASCSCMMFERLGVLCRHVIWIYSGHGVKKIPKTYICRRWSKEAVAYNEGLGDETDIRDERHIKMSTLWSEIHKTIGVLRGREKEDVEKLCTMIREFRTEIIPDVTTVNKQQEMEMLLGCDASQEVSILPPKICKNKGTGKRLLSSKTKSMIKAKRPKRMCNNCKRMANHDRRNCPNPPRESPSSDDEAEGNSVVGDSDGSGGSAA